MHLMNGKQYSNLKLTFKTYAPITIVVRDFHVKSLLPS